MKAEIVKQVRESGMWDPIGAVADNQKRSLFVVMVISSSVGLAILLVIIISAVKSSDIPEEPSPQRHLLSPSTRRRTFEKKISRGKFVAAAVWGFGAMVASVPPVGPLSTPLFRRHLRPMMRNVLTAIGCMLLTTLPPDKYDIDLDVEKNRVPYLGGLALQFRYALLSIVNMSSLTRSIIHYIGADTAVLYRRLPVQICFWQMFRFLTWRPALLCMQCNT